MWKLYCQRWVMLGLQIAFILGVKQLMYSMLRDMSVGPGKGKLGEKITASIFFWVSTTF